MSEPTTDRQVRTNVVIDDLLMTRAMELTGLDTKRAVVDAALRALVRQEEQGQVRSLRGALAWEGDLDEMRGAGGRRRRRAQP